MGWSRWFLILTLCFQIPKSFSSFTSDLFDTWCKQHKKTYSSEQEKLYRLKVFEDNYAFVTHHNTFMVNSSYTLSLNAFADLTHHEFKASRFGRLASKDLSRLDSGPSNEESSDAFDFELNQHVVTIDGYTDVPPNKEKRLLQAVAAQPVSVGICGSERAFQLYSKGIFDGPCSTSLDHAVLIVEYEHFKQCLPFHEGVQMSSEIFTGFPERSDLLTIPDNYVPKGMFVCSIHSNLGNSFLISL
ncbi:xylem bark cysteine peptidase 3 [Actinidia rufa]|uniref:Xylem bark cysteine peptidase 3 n=1 Tax=Actinidia rufa TaxID=165716 RepID=A0A7J0GHT2_9ERIC|nr:xylem bark cysteine peptidase 3 [Actinidia rufa]